LEAGLGWITKFSKPFVGSDLMKKNKELGINTKLVGFEMIDRGIPRHDYIIGDVNGKPIGKVTSGTQSPSLQKGIGMGYVPASHAKENTEITVLIRDKAHKAKVVKTPFYTNPQ